MDDQQQRDHDLLVEISTKIDLFGVALKDHISHDDRTFAILEKDLRAAHRRMDWLTTSGILSIVLLVITMILRWKFGG